MSKSCACHLYKHICDMHYQHIRVAHGYLWHTSEWCVCHTYEWVVSLLHTCDMHRSFIFVTCMTNIRVAMRYLKHTCQRPVHVTYINMYVTCITNTFVSPLSTCDTRQSHVHVTHMNEYISLFYICDMRYQHSCRQNVLFLWEICVTGTHWRHECW